MAANEDLLRFDVGSGADHDAWFRAKVLEALEDLRPAVPQADVEAYFARRRAIVLSAIVGRDA